jgi:hypothetical protein
VVSEFPDLRTARPLSRGEPGPHAAPASAARPLNVCVIAPEPGRHLFADGTTLGCVGLAGMLAQMGHAVTILALAAQRDKTPSALTEWLPRLERLGSRPVSLPDALPFPIGAHRYPALSYRVFEWLRDREFDVVHLPDQGGYGYYSMLAKHQGLAFARTTFCVEVYGPMLWAQAARLAAIGDIEQLPAAFMEQQSVALADAVVACTRDRLRWMEQWGWRLPRETYVCRPVPPDAGESPPGHGVHALRELVFVTCSNHTQDFSLFREALAELAGDVATKVPATVLEITGRAGAARFEQRAIIPQWPSRTAAVRTWSGAAAYLAGAGGQPCWDLPRRRWCRPRVRCWPRACRSCYLRPAASRNSWRTKTVHAHVLNAAPLLSSLGCGRCWSAGCAPPGHRSTYARPKRRGAPGDGRRRAGSYSAAPRQRMSDSS